MRDVVSGTTAVRTESVVHDIHDDVERQLLEVHITTFCCCDSLGSFYNEAGEVEGKPSRLKFV